MAPSRLTCVFHSSPTIVALLNAPAGAGLVGELLIECAPLPALGFTLSLETPVNYPGLPGLLGGVDVASLAHVTDLLPAPIVLAPGAAANPEAARAALIRLALVHAGPGPITLLVPMGYASVLGAALAVATQFTLAWDVSEFPHAELLDFSRWLDQENLLDRASFAGMLAYASQPVDAPHTQRLTALLEPLATTAHPAGVIPLA